MTGASIVPAGPDDAQAIAGLHRRLFDPPWDAASVAALMAPPAGVALAAWGRDACGTPVLAGFVLARVAADEAEILSLGVAPEMQGRGLARRLVCEVQRRLAERGARSLFLEVAADNIPALALYRRLGLGESGRRRGYYARSGAAAADALVLSKSL